MFDRLRSEISPFLQSLESDPFNCSNSIVLFAILRVEGIPLCCSNFNNRYPKCFFFVCGNFCRRRVSFSSPPIWRRWWNSAVSFLIFGGFWLKAFFADNLDSYTEQGDSSKAHERGDFSDGWLSQATIKRLWFEVWALWRLVVAFHYSLARFGGHSIIGRSGCWP